MDYFSNNIQVTFEEMNENEEYKEALKKENIIFDDLMKALENREYERLKDILDSEVIKDPSIMEPILYSVKNEHDTYKVYKYCGENIKGNIDLAKKVIIEEPELIKDTVISDNKQFILETAEINPEVVMHMSDTLKSDSAFTQELCELSDPDVTKYVARECKMPDAIIENPELANNKEFMTEAIRQEPEMLEHTPEELKNDYDFIKETCKDNKEVIKYISENTDKFGKEGLSGTKDALIDISTEEAVNGFDEEQKKVQEEIRVAEENGDDRLDELLKRDKQLERHKKFFERIKNGEVDPVRAAKMIDKYCANLDEGYREELKQLLKIDEAIVDKQKEEEKNNEQQEPRGNEEGLNEEVTIQPGDIETKTENASLEGVKAETQGIRERIKEERVTTNEIGEQTNDDNDERT